VSPRPDPFGCVPPARPGCRATVVIPARDEALRIGRTVAALANQRDVDGTRLEAGTFDVLVYANNCSDATADIVRSAAARYPGLAIHVAEEWLPPNVAHIGTARRSAMNAAAARLRAARIEKAALCATDADSVVAPTWLAWTLRELEGADVVTGRITIDPLEYAALPQSVRVMLAEEDAYHFAVTRLAACLNPVAHDPWPRHWQRSGPSLAVRLAAYEEAGGVPPVRTLEDVALYDALARSGARIRHSLRVRVATSARFHSRAPGGFGERIGTWHAAGDGYRPLIVPNAHITIAELRGDSAAAAAIDAPGMPAAEATAILRQASACGVRDARATLNNVASIAG
jgi:hypothetical protein